MSMAQRLHKIRLNHPAENRLLDRAMNQPRAIPVVACPKDRAKSRDVAEEVANHWLATQRKPLEQVEPIAALRWLLRKYFAWRGFACRSHVCDNRDGKHGEGNQCDGKCYASIEYRGTFDNESDARWAANCDGGEVKPIPFNAALPEETVSYGVGDVPQSEASQFYRQGVALPFTAIERGKIERLREKIRTTDPIVEGFRMKAT